MSCGRLQAHTLHNLLDLLAAEVGPVDVTLLLGQLAEEDLQAGRTDEIACAKYIAFTVCGWPTSTSTACRAASAARPDTAYNVDYDRLSSCLSNERQALVAGPCRWSKLTVDGMGLTEAVSAHEQLLQGVRSARCAFCYSSYLLCFLRQLGIDISLAST